MHYFVFFLFAALPFSSGRLEPRDSSLPPCESQLRLIFPQFFTHCDCHYSEWSEWVVDATTAVDVPTSQCPSGYALNETRTQTAVGQGCNDKTQTRQICAPDVEDRLIMALGLGSSGRHITPELPVMGLLPGNVSHEFTRRSTFCSTTQKCQHLTESRGKRYFQEEIKYSKSVEHSKLDPLPLEYDPIPFEWNVHGNRFRRQAHPANRECHPDGTQHILFILDTSGSIGQATFQRMTSKLSELVASFCKPVKVAVMTFNHEYHVEFCFNCFDNTCTGRNQAKHAISNIQYRSGYTHTAGAARCACEFFLRPSCGIDPSANCIDVVIITDGRSNDPTRDVCAEIQCLHNDLAVNTYAIGVGSIRREELDCIRETSNILSIFDYNSFDDFIKSMTEVQRRLLEGLLSGSNPYRCVDPVSWFGTEECD